jgi:hypothetical protein
MQPKGTVLGTVAGQTLVMPEDGYLLALAPTRYLQTGWEMDVGAYLLPAQPPKGRTQA